MKCLRLKEEWKNKLPISKDSTSNDLSFLLPEVSDDIQVVMDTTEYLFGYAGCVRIGSTETLIHYTSDESFDKVFEDCKKFIETYYEQVKDSEVTDKIRFPDTCQWYVLENPVAKQNKG